MPTTTSYLSHFAKDVLEGLSAKEKFIPSKYFYDKKGDRLFQQIMHLPEYYLTKKEFEILDKFKDRILAPIIQQEKEFNLVELGAGDGLKTKILIDFLIQEKIKFKYFPIDISGNALEELSKALKKEFPGLGVQPIENSYGEALKMKNWNNGSPSLLLFLGANMGNFNPEGVDNMVQLISGALQAGDQVLMGIDLKKDPELILKAYHDKQGVTKTFNLNVLERINMELGGDFKLDQFKHWPVYNPMTGECKSYLVAMKNQTVHIEGIKKTIYFKKAESIHTEISKKFDLEEVMALAQGHGFEIVKNFLDDQEFFADSLWRKQ
ncbi:L-histidine N(alpha)-methyltransferase [Echinicola jeungdonensis]|uniref:L-histidine N(Alpha)-methyltransferase n=1 Tax=Echinicola jeungdonensis TaxID=709343 RepID=A0ABV5J1S2_9BACT|nr:L-histidine N(alpha)-methyltransferase [Echinicola jeungdonensis]MDN3671141.1 L-histidine N(alpha)-methyltransferase [Echinicola jeungdonensis]